MPRENIRDRYEDPKLSATACAVVELTWMRAPKDHVEIGVIRRDFGGRRIEGEGNDGMFVSLDREGINKLIRLLRRARDQAFGADA